MLNAPASNRPNQTSHSAQLRLLIVEDHSDTSDALCRLLRHSGYAVESSATAAGALKLLEEASFDIVVSDLGLPDATGYDLMERIHGSYPVKGIAMSGYGMDEDIQKSLESGFSDHLVKPIKLEQLEEAIRRAVMN